MTRFVTQRWICAAAIASATLILSACSMTRLLYDQADWLLLREMDSYLDLRDEQRERLAGELAVSLARHRSEQLPQVASTLHGAANRARQGITGDDVDWIYEQGWLLLVSAANELIPALATTLRGLDPAQRVHLRRRLEERNREYRDSHWLERPPAERSERRARRMVDRVEKWTGPLAPEQVELVAEIRKSTPDSAAAWLAYTRSRQQDLMALLESGAATSALEALLRGWWLRLEGMPPELERMRDARLASTRELVVRLGATLDSVQRAHLVRRLESLAEDAASLSRAA